MYRQLTLHHWTVHFTPTLLLLVPFYRIFESQLLPSDCWWIALILTSLIWVRIYRQFYPNYFQTQKGIGALFFTLIFSNYYCPYQFTFGSF